MFPCIAISDFSNGTTSNTELGSDSYQPVSICDLPSDSTHIVFGQFCKRMIVSKGRVIPILSSAILCVGFVCPEKQVRGIDTWRIVAMMANDHPLWDWTMSQLPRDAVCHLQRVWHLNSAVAVRDAICTPFPAGIRSARRVNLWPKPLAYRLRLCRVVALHRAIFTRLPLAVHRRHEISARRTGGKLWGRIVVHSTLLSLGATPRTVPAVAGSLRALSIPENRMVMGVSHP